MPFAGAPDPRGDLSFGFVATGAVDRHLVLFGTAQHTGHGWRYRPAREDAIAHRCDVGIERSGGALRIAPAGGADCQTPTAGGLTTPGVKPIEFTSKDLQGQVTWQCSSAPAFEALATECPR